MAQRAPITRLTFIQYASTITYSQHLIQNRYMVYCILDTWCMCVNLSCGPMKMWNMKMWTNLSCGIITDHVDL